MLYFHGINLFHVVLKSSLTKTKGMLCSPGKLPFRRSARLHCLALSPIKGSLVPRFAPLTLDHGCGMCKLRRGSREASLRPRSITPEYYSRLLYHDLVVLCVDTYYHHSQTSITGELPWHKSSTSDWILQRMCFRPLWQMRRDTV